MLATAILTISDCAFAQNSDAVQQKPAELYGSAQQYATQPWWRLFPEKVEICIGYGTEKETWLRQEVAKFQKNPDNRNLTIKLVPIGSLVGVDAIEKNAGHVGSGLTGCTMTAWSPASAAYRDYVLQRTYRAIAASGAQVPGIASAYDLLAAQASSLARIPLVFVLWPAAYKKVVNTAQKSGDTATSDAALFTFDNLIRTERDESPHGGYSMLYKMPPESDGGYVTLYTTNPGESNSGFSTLLLMAYAFTSTNRAGIDANQVSPRNSEFWSSVKQFYTSSEGTSLRNYKSASTGTLFQEQFVVGGPQSNVSGVVSYENLAIQYADLARKTYGTVYRVVYPPLSVMADNPYYVLNAVYDAAAHKTVLLPEKEKKAAIAFMQFLLEPEQQRDAIALGLRPGNPQVAAEISAAGSPFVTMKDIGIDPNPTGVRFVSTQNVDEAVIGNLLAGWNDLADSLK
jgi:hypothetical protein